MHKTVGLRQLFTLGVGTIVGGGWLIVLGEPIVNAGPIGAIIAFAIGAACMLPIALCYGELGGMMPETGGEIVYSQRIFGDNAAYAAGVSLFVIYLINCVFFGVSVGWLANKIVPGLKGPILYTVLGDDVHLGSIIIGLLITSLLSWVNFRGAKWATAFQDIATYILLASACVFVIVGLFVGDSQNLQPIVVKTDWAWGWGGVLGVLATTPYFFGGFSTIPQALGELADHNDRSRIGAVLCACVGFSLLFYCLIFLAVSCVMPRDQFLQHELPIPAAFSLALSNPVMGKVVLIVGVVGLLACWNACFFAATRVLYAMSKHGMIHQKFSTLHRNHASPLIAIGLVFAVGCAGLFLGQGFLIPVVNLTSTLFALLYLLVTFGLLKVRSERSADETPAYVAPGGKALVIFGALFSAYLLLLSLAQQSAAVGWRWPIEWSVLLSLLVTAWGWRVFMLRRIPVARSAHGH